MSIIDTCVFEKEENQLKNIIPVDNSIDGMLAKERRTHR
jgi:hypothetical protein